VPAVQTTPPTLEERSRVLSAKLDQLVRDPRLILLLPLDARNSIAELGGLVACIASAAAIQAAQLRDLARLFAANDPKESAPCSSTPTCK
jgi:hypothetical protein